MNIVVTKTASCPPKIHSLFLPNRTLIYFGWKCTQIKGHTFHSPSQLGIVKEVKVQVP